MGIAATARRTVSESAQAATRHFLMAAAIVLLLATHAHAQVCSDSDAQSGTSANPGGAAATASARYFLNCDMAYKNTELMCDTNKVRGSCPSQPMMMKQTPLRSFIKEYSPYLYAYARDPDDRSKPYTGPFYRGTPGDANQTFGLVCPPGRRCPASCTSQIKFPSEAKSPEEEAKMVRLQLDNCADQYVLNAAMYPYQKENVYLLSGEDPNDGSKRISVETSCQPIKTVQDTKNEYLASDYLKAAWIKLLQDPTYRKNPKAPKEPHLPDNVKIDNPVPPPSPFPSVRISSVGTIPYEEINDPTHPFSPRWDYEFNERDHYSPKTEAYSKDPKNSVFCAGDKDQAINKVDILSFREARIKFDEKVNKRIDFNKNCMANSGMQKNPCCVPSGFLGLTCKMKPCAQCYGMTAESPVCTTNYVTQPDRKKVKVPYLPVHPALRIAGQVASLSSMSLSNLSNLAGGALSVAQASGLLSSQLSILSALPNGLSIGQVLPMLGVQSNVLAALSGLSGSISPASLVGVLASQTNLLNSLPGNLSPSMISGLLNGQGLSLSALGNAAGLPINQVMGALKSPQSLLNSVVAQTPLGDIQHLVNNQLHVIDSLVNRNLNVGDAARLVGVDLRAIENLPENMTLTQALAQGVRLTGVDLPGNLSVRDVRSILNSTTQGLSAFNAGDPASLLDKTVSSQLRAITQLPSGLPVGQVSSILGSVQEIMRTPANATGAITGQANAFASVLGRTGVLNAGDLQGVMSAINTNMGGINDIAGQLGSLGNVAGGLGGALGGLGNIGGLGGALGIDRNQLTGILGGQLGALNSLSGTMGLSGIAGALNGQLAGLSNLTGSLPIGDIKSLLGTQLGSLSGIAGNLNLGAIAGGLDTKILGGIPGLGGNLNLGSIPGLDLSKLVGQLPIPDLKNLLGGIPGLSSGTISNILSGKLPLGSIPGINQALAGLPNLNNILAAKIPGLDKLLKGLPGTEVTELPTVLVVAMYFPRTAKCNPNEFGDANSTPMAQMCRDLRAPYTPLNKLRMRYHNPDEQENIVFKDGVPEGYGFHDYFKDDNAQYPAHMPYPRLWDTGRSIQKTPSDEQDPKDTSGQWTTIVGVGHEATPGSTAAPAATPGSGPAAASTSSASRTDQAKTQRMKDQRCLFGGWGGNVSMGGVSVQLPDPIASWTELKLYQTRTLRDTGLSCLARYEKTYKLGSTEEKALVALGADPAQAIITQKQPNGPDKYLTLKEWRDQNQGNGSGTGTGTGTGTGIQPPGDIMQLRAESFPLAWRGYLSAKDTDQQFPNFPTGNATTKTGLNNAEVGDILLMPNGASGDNSKHGLPTVAIVTDEMQKGVFVKVIEADAGKWPDVCGTTDGWGEMKTRYLYKPGSLPTEAQHEYQRIHSTSDCADNHLTQCEAKNWDTVKLYRVREDRRQGNDGSELKTPTPQGRSGCFPGSTTCGGGAAAQ